MRNRHGTPIWYELMAQDPAAARRFYSAVFGWTIDESPPPGSTLDYRMIAAGTQFVGGLMTLSEDMQRQGARPCWMMYLGVDDVDACVADLTAAGGKVHLPAFDIPGVGRIAMLADPQGASFYVMRGSSNETSTACDPMTPGHGAWHELHTTDGVAAADFYLDQFGWKREMAMDMGEMGPYQIYSIEGKALGAFMKDPGFEQPEWLVYFRVDGVEEAARRIVQAGGTVSFGPSEVPGGDWIVNGLDLEGARFALVGPRQRA